MKISDIENDPLSPADNNNLSMHSNSKHKKTESFQNKPNVTLPDNTIVLSYSEPR